MASSSRSGTKRAALFGSIPLVADNYGSSSIANTREVDMGLEVWSAITTEYNGRTIKGSFKFIDGMVNVRTPHASKTTQSGGHTPEQMAENLLRQLAREGKA